MRKRERKLFFYTKKLCERVAREVKKEKERRARATSYLTVNSFSIEICKNSRSNLKGIFSCLREGLVPCRSSLPKWRSLAKQVGETPSTTSRFRSTVTNSLTSVFRQSAVWIRPFWDFAARTIPRKKYSLVRLADCVLAIARKMTNVYPTIEPFVDRRFNWKLVRISEKQKKFY